MEQNLVIGIDVGGQTTKCGVVDARGTVLAQTVIRSDSYTTVEPYIEELAAALKKIITDSTDLPFGTGIGDDLLQRRGKFLDVRLDSSVGV